MTLLKLPCFSFNSKDADCAGAIELDASTDPGTAILCSVCGKSRRGAVYLNARRVDLTDAEMRFARKLGLLRNAEAKKQGRPDSFGLRQGSGVHHHVHGARAELAFAKFWGVNWMATVNTYKLPDVGEIQVKGRSRLGYDLIVRPLDLPETPTVLVTGLGPTFYVMGWILTGDAQNEPGWRREYGGRDFAYFVPAEALRPMEDLRNPAASAGGK